MRILYTPRGDFYSHFEDHHLQFRGRSHNQFTTFRCKPRSLIEIVNPIYIYQQLIRIRVKFSGVRKSSFLCCKTERVLLFCPSFLSLACLPDTNHLSHPRLFRAWKKRTVDICLAIAVFQAKRILAVCQGWWKVVELGVYQGWIRINVYRRSSGDFKLISMRPLASSVGAHKNQSRDRVRGDGFPKL